MSIASELNNLEGNIEDSYDAVNDMGGIIPAQKNMDNLDQAIRTIPQNQGTTYTAGNGIDITNDVISIDDTVVAELSDLPGVMTGATSSTAGTSGLVPAPAAGDQDKVLKGDGTWGAAADTATVIYMVKTADSGTHDYTVVFYTELAHTNTVSYSTINGYVTEGKSVLIVDGNKSSGSPLAAVTGSPKGSGPMNTVVDGSLYKFSYSSGTTYLDIDGILSPPIQTNMIADGAVTNAKLDWSNIVETVSVSDYITPASGYTLSDTFGYRIGKMVILCFAFHGTIVSGENVIGSCSNNFACDFFGAGRVARWQGGTDNTAITVMCIPGGNCRIYSPAANTQGMATVVLVET